MGGRADLLTILITGTNGKTTITHLIKHICRRAGLPIYSNIHWEDDREERADRYFELLDRCRAEGQAGIFILEVDEGDFAYFAERIRPEFAVVANLSRNQLYLYGELSGLVAGIKQGLEAVPDCRLICCADDPLVAALAREVSHPERVFYYGLDEHSGPVDSSQTAHYFIESPHCTFCTTLLDYRAISFSNYGEYHCPSCGFKRPERQLEFKMLGSDGFRDFYAMTFPDGEELKVGLLLPTLMNAYNAAAAALVTTLCGLSAAQVRTGLEQCIPARGRFERLISGGQEICLLRGENPEAVNASLAWALSQPDFGALILSLDDPEKNHAGDISWLWDVLFEKLPFAGPIGCTGSRAYDLALRLQYAGVDPERLHIAELSPTAQAELTVLAELKAKCQPRSVYWLCDKTAAHRLRPAIMSQSESLIDQLRAALAQGEEAETVIYSLKVDSLQRRLTASEAVRQEWAQQPESALSVDDRLALQSLHATEETAAASEAAGLSLRLAYLYPEELNLYGDRGNVLCLVERARLRGIEVKVQPIGRGQPFDPLAYDLVFMGGGQDSDQDAVYGDFVSKAEAIRQAVEDAVVFLCICGAYQLMGRNYLTAQGKKIQGLGILDLETRALGRRMVGDLVFRRQGEPSAAGLDPAHDGRYLLGFENHGGETFLGPEAQVLGQVLRGFGNNSTDEGEGCRCHNLFGTYAHGAFLPRNPEMADELLELALAHRYPGEKIVLEPLSEDYAIACRQAVFERLGLSSPEASI